MLRAKTISQRGIMNFPKRAVPFGDHGFVLSGAPKVFSCNFHKVLSTLQGKFGNSLYNSSSFISVKLNLYSPVYSQYHMNGQSFRLLNMIERSFSLGMGLTSFGYVVFFDLTKKQIKATFYFTNIDDVTGKPIYKDISSQEKENLAKLVETKVNLFKGITMDESFRASSKLIHDYNESKELTVSKVSPSDEVSLAVFNFSVLLADRVCLKAFERALRGLDYERALKLTSAVNAIIEVNEDSSIPLLALPKKFVKQIAVDCEVGGNPHLTDDIVSMLDIV